MKEDKKPATVRGRRVHTLAGFDELAQLVRTIKAGTGLSVPEVLDFALPVLREKAKRVLSRTVKVGG